MCDGFYICMCVKIVYACVLKPPNLCLRDVKFLAHAECILHTLPTLTEQTTFGPDTGISTLHAVYSHCRCKPTLQRCGTTVAIDPARATSTTLQTPTHSAHQVSTHVFLTARALHFFTGGCKMCFRVTPVGHPDHEPLQNACKMIEDVTLHIMSMCVSNKIQNAFYAYRSDFEAPVPRCW